LASVASLVRFRSVPGPSREWLLFAIEWLPDLKLNLGFEGNNTALNFAHAATPIGIFGMLVLWLRTKWPSEFSAIRGFERKRC
jgi:hypothetical protein